MIYLLMVGFSVSSLIISIDHRSRRAHPNSNRLMRDAVVLSQKENNLVITDFSDNDSIGLGAFISVLNECKSDTMAIFRTSKSNDSIPQQIIAQEYSDIYIYHASNALAGQLRSQFGEQLDSVRIEGISPMWKTNKKSIVD